MKRWDWWDWGSFWMGVMLTLLAIVFLTVAYQVGSENAWRDASRVVGCAEGTKIEDIPDYASSIDGRIIRFVCEEPRWRTK